MAERRRIIIDTDPGQDDAIAILLALASDELEVLGLTIVAGNVPLELTVRAARTVVELADRRDVPIHPGSPRPIGRPLVTAEHVHGDTGLDGPDLPAPTVPVSDEHGVDFLIRSLREAEPGEITLVTLGPLTNVALALVKAPDIAPRIREIVAVIGSFAEGGNITPLGDFNCYVDPDAADLVLTSGIPFTAVPMDVTHRMRTTDERLDRLWANGNRSSRAAVEMLRFSQVFDIEKYGWEAGPLHDPCAVLYLLAPELFTGRRINLRAVTKGTVATGMTVVDWWGVSGREPNVDYLMTVDVQPAFDLLTERLGTLA
jgi:purine nucleosidase